MHTVKLSLTSLLICESKKTVYILAVSRESTGRQLTCQAYLTLEQLPLFPNTCGARADSLGIHVGLRF